MRNDLAQLEGLVRLEGRALRDPEARAVLAATAERVHLLARVQERLRWDDGGAVVEARAFLTDLADDLRAAVVGAQPIALTVAVEPARLPRAQAVAVGLIMNELVTNALKYAFSGGRAGTIGVRFTRAGDVFCLAVTDNGVGIRPQQPQGSGLGQRLVQSLAAQLGGTLEIAPHAGAPGTRAMLRFPATR
jgi:two-component sensor histidine kinase